MTTGVVWVKVRASHYQRPWISPMLFTKQPSQRLLLSLRPCVARSLAVIGYLVQMGECNNATELAMVVV